MKITKKRAGLEVTASDHYPNGVESSADSGATTDSIGYLSALEENPRTSSLQGKAIEAIYAKTRSDIRQQKRKYVGDLNGGAKRLRKRRQTARLINAKPITSSKEGEPASYDSRFDSTDPNRPTPRKEW